MARPSAPLSRPVIAAALALFVTFALPGLPGHSGPVAFAQSGPAPSGPAQSGPAQTGRVQTAPRHPRGSLTVWEDVPSDLAGVPSIERVLGFSIGEHFLRHEQTVEAFEAIAAASPRVSLREYGRTHQRRPLLLATVASPENHRRLDEILAANLRLADPSTPDAEARRIIETNPVIIWLSFGVHGNEASAPEAALLTLHKLAAATGPEIDRVLANAVIFIDPQLNPDGRTRYVSWYENQYGVGASQNNDPQSAEHDEPWPGGRTNHYLFDLNRDWIWLVQPESRARLTAYRAALPQVHIDNHEQGHTSPYFFGPGDEPYNANIPRETRDWIEYLGSVYADTFDLRGKLYSTRERFDYLYPGYGKVLPIYHGAVGMLMEQGGHGRAGLAIAIDDRYDLTLAERAGNHFLTNMATVEATAINRQAQLDRFRRYFTESVALGRSEPFSVIVSPDNDPALLERLWDFCRAHGVAVRTLDRLSTAVALHDYRTGEPVPSPSLDRGSWLISAEQPRGRLVRAALERSPIVTDRDTYDVTSWSLPVALGLRAYYTHDPVTGGRPLESWAPPPGRVVDRAQGRLTAYVVSAGQHRFPAAVNAAAEHRIAARYTGEPITIDARDFPTGSLIVHERRNRHGRLDEFVAGLTAQGLEVHATAAGVTEEGPVLGANANPDFRTPRIGLLQGEPVDAYSFGALWHTLDIDQPLPYSNLRADSLARLDLSKYRVIALPDSGPLPQASRAALEAFVRDGGTLVAIAGGARWAQRELLGLEPVEQADDRPPASQLTRAERAQRLIDDRIPGSFFQVRPDPGHPLAAGLGEWLGVIKRDASVLAAGDSTEIIAAYATDHTLIGGVASDRNRDFIAGKPYMTAHRLGSGRVICLADDPTFRGFTHAAKRLLLNALIYGPSL